MNYFLKTVLMEEEEVEVIMEEGLLPEVRHHLVIEGLLPEVRHLTGKDWKAFAFKKNDVQLIKISEDVLKTLKTMAYWVSL
jgi:hypothetical protein